MFVVGKGRILRPGFLNDVVLAAESRDGGWTWRYVGNAAGILDRDRPYDRDGTASVFAMWEEGRFRLWYTAFRYRDRSEADWLARATHGCAEGQVPYLGIGYAESRDGLQWTKPIDHLVVAPREATVEPVEHWVAKPWIVRRGPDDYRMWVSALGRSYRIHALHSRDGRAWIWDRPDGGPDLDDGAGVEPGLGAPGAFDAAMRGYPSIWEVEGHWHCWYTGNGYGATGIGHAVGDAVDQPETERGK